MKKIALLFVIPILIYSCNNNQKTEEQEEVIDSTIEAVSEESENGVFFVSPSDGSTVENPVKLIFGVNGMDIEPAGIVNEGKGHHHIIIDGTFIEQGNVVPTDSMNIHYGKGQIETEITLSPGKHTLTMQFADGFHQSYGREWSTTIEVVIGQAELSNED